MKVTEEEHEVIEKEIDTYVCDRCGDEMGDEPDHTIQVNPRLKLTERRGRAATPADQRAPDRHEHVREMNEYSRGPGFNDPDDVAAIVDDEMEWCESCVNQTFQATVLATATEKVSQASEKVTEASGKVTSDDDSSGVLGFLIGVAIVVGFMMLILLL